MGDILTQTSLIPCSIATLSDSTRKRWKWRTIALVWSSSERLLREVSELVSWSSRSESASSCSMSLSWYLSPYVSDLMKSVIARIPLGRINMSMLFVGRRRSKKSKAWFPDMMPSYSFNIERRSAVLSNRGERNVLKFHALFWYSFRRLSSLKLSDRHLIRVGIVHSVRNLFKWIFDKLRRVVSNEDIPVFYLSEERCLHRWEPRTGHLHGVSEMSWIVRVSSDCWLRR